MGLSWRSEEGCAYVRLRMAEPFVGLIQAILESYEGLALVRTFDAEGSVMVIVTTEEQSGVVGALLEDLGRVTPWEEDEKSDDRSLVELLGGK
jgi:hypothetical protein